MARDFDSSDRSGSSDSRGNYRGDSGYRSRGDSGGGRDEIKPKIIYTLTEADKYTIRVVQWLKNGSPVGRPQLEKREVYQDHDGNQKTGKVKGFAFDDMELIKENWNTIKGHLGSKSSSGGSGERSSPAPRGESRGESRTKPKETRMDAEDTMPDDMPDDTF